MNNPAVGVYPIQTGAGAICNEVELGLFRVAGYCSECLPRKR